MEIVSEIIGCLFGIVIIVFFIACTVSTLGEKRPKRSNTELTRLEQENQSLKDEITRLKKDNYELSKKNKETLDEVKRKDAMIYNLGLDFSNCEPSPLIPHNLRYSYLKSLSTERLERATNGEFDFKYPITISATTLSTDNYKTTLESCTCDACQKGHAAVCKHMLALALQMHAFTPYKDYVETLLNNLIEQNKIHAEQLKEIKAVKDEYKRLQKALNDRYQSHPYLADMIADYKIAQIDARVKDPCTKRDLMEKMKRLEKEKAMLKNRIALHEFVYPTLKDLKNARPEELVQTVSIANTTDHQDQ